MAFLTKAQAQARAERLAHHIRKYGVKVVIDLRTGAGGNHWGVDTHIGAMAHHIVSRRSQGSTPFYSLVRNGRVDVPGPLCNIYGGWDRVARIVTMGLANHPGRGGPWVISGRRIPRDNGRYYFLGTEFEGGLREADWDDDYRRFMGAVNAGKVDYLREMNPGLNLRDTALCEHSSWAPGRKVDRLGYTQAKGVAEMQAARRASGDVSVKPITIPPEDDDMPLTNDDIRRIWTHTHPSQMSTTDMRGFMVSTYRKLAEVEAAQAGLIGAIAALGRGEPFDEAKLLEGVRKAAQQGVAEAVDSIDTTVTINRED